MEVAHDYKTYAEWMRFHMNRLGIRTLRQAVPRLHIAHTTILMYLGGSLPSIGTAIKIAEALNADIAESLELAGHPQVAAIWRARGASPRRTYKYEVAEEEEEEIVASFGGIPPAMRGAALEVLKSIAATAPKDSEASPPHGSQRTQNS